MQFSHGSLISALSQQYIQMARSGDQSIAKNIYLLLRQFNAEFLKSINPTQQDQQPIQELATIPPATIIPPRFQPISQPSTIPSPPYEVNPAITSFTQSGKTSNEA
jgi:hypothetical protein